MMITLAKLFFWLHTGLCLVYGGVVGRALVRAVSAGISPALATSRFGDLLIVDHDKVIDGMTYLVLGLFLLYAEVYMYRIYSVASAFSL